MNELIEFKPIVSNSPKRIKQYYIDNNIPLSNNQLFQKYLEGGDSTPTESYEINEVIDSPNQNKPTSKVEKTKLEILASRATPNTKSSDFNVGSVNENTIISEINSKPITDDMKNYLIVMAKRESYLNPNAENQYGYYGLYQFGKGALKDTGYTKNDFRLSDNQHNAMIKFTNLNEKRLGTLINTFNGKTKNGIKITKNGILAAAHLLGPSTVKDWFLGTKNTDIAKNGFVDGNGTKIEEYLQLFNE